MVGCDFARIASCLAGFAIPFRIRYALSLIPINEKADILFDVRFVNNCRMHAIKYYRWYISAAHRRLGDEYVDPGKSNSI